MGEPQQYDRREVDRDRIVRLEVVAETIHKDFERVHEDLKSVENAFEHHVSVDNVSFQEINKGLILLSSTVREVSVSVTELRESVKDMRISQELMTKDIMALANCRESVTRMQAQVDTSTRKIEELEAIKNKQMGGWKTMTIVALVVSFIWGATWKIVDHFDKRALVQQQEIRK